MKKFMKNPWVIGIGTTVISSVLLTLINDWIKKVDWLTTLKATISFIVNAVIAFLNFELKVWWLLVAISLLVIALIIISKMLDARENSKPIPFLRYTKDSMLGYTWEWDYRQAHDGKYTITNLHPVCSKCGMRLKQDFTMYGMAMKCLRCNTTQKWEDHYKTDTQLLIEDNIRVNYFQNQ